MVDGRFGLKVKCFDVAQTTKTKKKKKNMVESTDFSKVTQNLM